MNNKSRILLSTIAILFLLLSVRVFWVSGIQGSSYESKSIDLIVNESSIIPPRGKIIDRNGVLLAYSKLSYIIHINTSSITDSALAKLNEVVGSERIIKTDTEYIIQNLTTEELNSIENLDFIAESNIKITTAWQRIYNHPYEFAHIIGYVGGVDAEDIESGNYDYGDKVGKYKLEKQLEDKLKGVKGKVINYSGIETYEEGKEGDLVQLTIDAYWQNELYRLFEDYNNRYNAAGGGGVVFDTENGEIISLVSYPGFDTNFISKGITVEDFSILENSRAKPLIDKVIGTAAAPGSTFKLITSFSLIDNDVINSSSQFFSNRCMSLGDSQFCEFGKNFYGNMNVVRALTKSSNVFFCNYLLEMEKKMGLGNFVSDALMFNIGSSIDIDIDGEVSGNMDSPEYKYRVTNDEWRPGDTCNAAIGQGAILVSPLQMAVVAGLIVNEGKVHKPRIQMSTEYEHPYITLPDNIDPEVYNLIKKGMQSVAYDNESATSGLLANLANNLYVKTGSAEVFEPGNNIIQVHSWIVGTFDYNNRNYSFAFFQQYGGGGYYITPLLSDFLKLLNNE